jgi:uncharacterized protein YxjI
MNGQVLFALRTKMLSIRKTYVAEDANEREIFRVTKKMGRECGVMPREV